MNLTISGKARDSWLAWTTVVLAVCGFFAGSARMAGPDEPWQQSTAWYAVHHGLAAPITGTAQSVSQSFPGVFAPEVCFAGKSAQDSSCLPERPSAELAGASVYNYPRPYYWVVGTGQVLAGVILGGWQDVGGRVFSLLLNLGVLTALGLRIRRSLPRWGTYLLLIATPMAAFTWAIVNPSGWEITMSIVFCYLLAERWWGLSRPQPNAGNPILASLPLAVASVVLPMARPSAFIWMAGFTVAALAMGRSPLDRRNQMCALAAVGCGIGVGVARNLLKPMEQLVANQNPVADPGLLDYLGWYWRSLDALPMRLKQMMGDLGSLDTPMPGVLFVGLLLAWAGFLGVLISRGRVPAMAVLVGVVFILLVPSAVEAVAWNEWPGWWQGRYTLPFAAGYISLLLIRYGRFVERPAVMLSLLSTLGLSWMVCLNAARYAFGLSGSLPARLSDPAIGYTRLWITLACAAMMVAIGVVRLATHLRGGRSCVESVPTTRVDSYAGIE